MRVKSPVFFMKAGDFFLDPSSPVCRQAGRNKFGEVTMNRFFYVIFSFVFLSLLPFSLFAEEEEVTLEEVVITATRDAQEIRKIPANITVISRKDIEESHSKTTVDLLRGKEGVVVKDFLGTGKTATVDIRGFGETASQNSLVLVDGRRVNAIDLSGVDWTQIPVEQIERIEIVRGSGSVLYGDNAVGGVINIITKSPEKPFSARLEEVRGSYGYHREGGSAGGKWGPFSAMVQADYSSTDGYRTNGSFRGKDIGGKLAYDLTEDLGLSFKGSLHRDDTGFPGALPENIYRIDRKAARNPFDKGETDDGYGSVGLRINLRDLGRIEGDLSYRHQKTDNSFPSSSYGDKRTLSTWGLTPRYVVEKPLLGRSNKVTLGADFYDSDSDAFSESVFSGPNRSEVKKRSGGIYLLDEFSLLSNLILSVGVRHEWVTFDLFQESPRLKESVTDHEPAWNVGLDYLFDRRSSAFFSVKRSFRFPVTDELIQLIFEPPSFEGRAQVNPNMKVQTGYHYEAGLRHAFSDRAEANLTLFWIDLKDEIFLNPVTFYNENLSKTRRQGIELGGRLRPFRLDLLMGELHLYPGAYS